MKKECDAGNVMLKTKESNRRDEDILWGDAKLLKEMNGYCFVF